VAIQNNCYTERMITDADIKKLKTVFVTKEDLDKSEARTAFGFTDVQSQISELKNGQIDLTEKVYSLSGKVDQLSDKVNNLSGEVKEISQQLRGMEQNIIQAIHETKDKQEDQEVRITKLERVAFSN